MVQRDQVGLRVHAVDDVLLVAARLPEREVEPVHTVGADSELVALAEGDAVFVERNGVDAVLGGDAHVVRDAGDRVSEVAVARRHVRIGLLTVGQTAPGLPVRVQVGALPTASARRVGIPEL